MFDTRFASDVAPRLSPGSILAALLLHLILVAATIELTQSHSLVVPFISRDTVRLDIGPLPPPELPPFPDLPYMPKVDAARLRRHSLRAVALAELDYPEVPRLQVLPTR